jgi:hypothetical protein
MAYKFNSTTFQIQSLYCLQYSYSLTVTEFDVYILHTSCLHLNSTFRFIVAPTTCSAHRHLLSSSGDCHSSLINTEAASETPTASRHTFDMSEVLSCDSLSSELNSYDACTQIKGAYIQSKMTSNISTVEHPITKHCPIITIRELTLQILLLAENTSNKFFIVKTIPKEDEVKLILGALKDVHYYYSYQGLDCDGSRTLINPYLYNFYS